MMTFETAPPQRPSARIAVQHFAPAAAAITCDGGLFKETRMLCGPTGMAAHVNSRFLGTSGSGDVYEVTIITQLQKNSSLKPGIVTTQETIKVLYKGARQVIFEDEPRRVILYPEKDGPAAERAMKAIDRSTDEK